MNDSLSLRLYLVLRRSPEQQADLDNLLSRQQQPAAAEYHQWLTPQEFGQRFGAAQQDIAKVTSWLQSQGLHVNGVLSNAGFIDFSATAGQVRQVFHTQLHNVNANGANYPAPLEDPMIPAALAPAIAAIHGLNQVPPRSNVVNPHQASYNLAAHRWQDVETVSGSFPAAYLGGAYDVTPRDFYTIYNVNKVLNPAPAGLNDLGAGQTIAVIAASNFPFGTVDPVTSAASGGDVATFRSMFGIAGTLNMHVYHGYGNQSCADPGINTNGNLDFEAALDAEWANALAPSANILVISCAGVSTALIAAVDYNLADIISLSFNFGGDNSVSQSTFTFFDSLWSQAAAQGQSVFVSSGDSGSDDADQNVGHAATSGLNVNVASASPLVTSAGGTDFSDSYDAQRGGMPLSSYWNSSNSAFYQSALGYVPETAWNTSCAGSILAAYYGYQPADYCAKVGGSGAFLGGSGGFSSHYAVPAYQLGTPGYSGTFRALPDISGFAAIGSWGHSLLFCDSDYSYSSCSSSSTIGAGGGTSFVAPYLAGIAALLNAYTGSRQGVLNPTLYGLAKAQFAASSTSAACYANGQSSNTGITVGLPAAQCIFNDVTTGNNDVPCAAGSLNCYTNPGAAYGILSVTNSASLNVAYSSTPGYDEATGLGSVNVYNLLTKWTSAFRSSVAFAANPTTILSNGSTLLTATVNGGVPAGYVDTPPAITGSVSFSAQNGTLGTCVLTGGTCSITLSGSALQAGVNSITATFQGSGTYPASTSSVQTVTVNGGSTQTITFQPLPTVTLGVAPFTLGATASSGLVVSYSSSTTSICTVTGGTVTVLTAGTCTITASQAGNATYAAAPPVVQSFTIAASPQVGYVAYWGVNNTGVTVSWSTDLPATTQLAYGTTTALGQTSPLQTTLSQSHGVVLTTLNPGTTYYFVAQSISAAGASGSSPVSSFRTTGTAAAPPPVITSVTATAISNTSADIIWTTDQATTSLVNYGATTSYGSSSTLNTSLVTSHSVTLTGLGAATSYAFDVVSANSSGISATSANFSFTTTTSTGAPPAAGPNVGYVAYWGVNNSGVTVSWSTDLPATTQLSYGTTAALGQLSPLQNTLSASHGVMLTSLNAGTTYYFIAQSSTAGGSTGYSTTLSFTTTGTPSSPAPVISNVTATNINSTSATITWTTDQTSSSQLNYGTTNSYGTATALDSTLVTSHSVNLTGLTAATAYNFQVVSANGNSISTTSTNYAFTTTGGGVLPPAISNIATSAITSSSATISWTTDQATSAQVNYGTTTAYGASSALNATLTTSHSVTLTGLAAGTTYNFSVVSANSAGASAASANSTFTTAMSAATPPYVGYVAYWGVNNTGATISWSSDVPATTQLAYGTTSALGQLSPLQTALSTSHGVVLTGLNPGTIYYFVAQSSAASGATGYSTTYSFTTTGTATAPAPLISSVLATGITGTSATISWTTDQASSSQVNYGPTTSYGSSSPPNTALVTGHSITLAGLTPGATYNFAVASANAAAISATSANYTFVTAPAGGTPPNVGYVAFYGINNSGVTVSWSTDLPANTQVVFGTTTALGQLSPLQTALVVGHGVTLSGLNPGTTYYFVAQSTNAGGVTGYSPQYSFTTTGSSAPVISAVTASPLVGNTATITWTTSTPAYSYVQFGPAAGSYNMYSAQTALTSNPQCKLPFVPGGTIHYQLVSTDVSGTQTVSFDATFIEP